MNESDRSASGTPWGGVLVSAFMVLVGVLTLVDTTSYSDMDSKVFPRVAAGSLIVLAVASLVQCLLQPGPQDGFGQGSWWRRLLLVGSMLLACLLMPIVGFLPAGIIAFAGSLLAAMHDRWRWPSALTFSLASISIIAAFHALFRYGLNVPLP